MNETRKPPDVSGAGLLVRGPPLSPGVVRGVGTTSRDPLPRAPLSVGALLDGKRVDLQSGAPVLHALRYAWSRSPLDRSFPRSGLG